MLRVTAHSNRPAPRRNNRGSLLFAVAILVLCVGTFVGTVKAHAAATTQHFICRDGDLFAISAEKVPYNAKANTIAIKLAIISCNDAAVPNASVVIDSCGGKYPAFNGFSIVRTTHLAGPRAAIYPLAGNTDIGDPVLKFVWRSPLAPEMTIEPITYTLVLRLPPKSITAICATARGYAVGNDGEVAKPVKIEWNNIIDVN